MSDDDLEPDGRTESRADPRRRRIGPLLVVAQFALLGALVALPLPAGLSQPVPVVVLGGLLVAAGFIVVVVAALGLGRGLTASSFPNAAARRRTDGAYRWVRHPIYGAILLGASGVVVASGSAARLAVFVALVVLLVGKARWEERWLLERSGRRFRRGQGPKCPGGRAFRQRRCIYPPEVLSQCAPTARRPRWRRRSPTLPMTAACSRPTWTPRIPESDQPGKPLQ